MKPAAAVAIMNIHIVRDGFVEAQQDVSMEKTLREGLKGEVVVPEQQVGYRWTGTFLTFSSEPYQSETFNGGLPLPSQAPSSADAEWHR